MKENNEKKMENCDEISKLIKAFPKDIAALDKRSVLAKVNSQGSGRQKPMLQGQKGVPALERRNDLWASLPTSKTLLFNYKYESISWRLL